jgi:hypothetical protein
MQITARQYTIGDSCNGIYVRKMKLDKKGALLMSIAVFFWTAVPAFACLADRTTHARGDCCVAMMQNCGASMTGSCCQLAPENKSPAAVSEFAPEHDYQSGILWQTSVLPAFTNSQTLEQALRLLPASDPSPGGFSILRV